MGLHNRGGGGILTFTLMKFQGRSLYFQGIIFLGENLIIEILWYPMQGGMSIRGCYNIYYCNIYC